MVSVLSSFQQTRWMSYAVSGFVPEFDRNMTGGVVESHVE